MKWVTWFTPFLFGIPRRVAWVLDANRRLNYSDEVILMNVGGPSPDAKTSSLSMLERGVGAVIVVGGWESQPQGEGPQEIDVPRYLITAKAP
jgi:hypothetical protein